MTSAKYATKKFISINNFALARLKICALLVQQGLLEVVEDKSRLHTSTTNKKE